MSPFQWGFIVGAGIFGFVGVVAGMLIITLCQAAREPEERKLYYRLRHP